MTESSQHPDVTRMTTLLTCYGFELDAELIEQWVQEWLTDYSVVWVRLAIVEALYQGRYKAISVQQILNAWQRRGEPIYHFDGEFERIVSRSIPRNLLLDDTCDDSSAADSTGDRWVDLELRQRLQQLRRTPKHPPSSKLPMALPPKQSGSIQSTTPAPKTDSEGQAKPESPSNQAISATPKDVPSQNSEDAELKLETALDSGAIATAIGSGSSLSGERPTPNPSAPEVPLLSELQASNPEVQPIVDQSITDLAITDLAVQRNEPIGAIAPQPELDSSELDSPKLDSFVSLHSIQSIRQFTPSARNTGFYVRLRAVATGDSQPVSSHSQIDW